MLHICKLKLKQKKEQEKKGIKNTEYNILIPSKGKTDSTGE